MGINEDNIATDEDGNDYAVETGWDSPGTSEEVTETPAWARRKCFGRRTLDAVALVAYWPGATHNAIANNVGRWRYTGQDAVHRALYYRLIENRGTPRRFALYVTERGMAALADAGRALPPPSDDSIPDSMRWTPDETLGHIDAVLAAHP